jgi:hypothetical protein
MNQQNIVSLNQTIDEKDSTEISNFIPDTGLSVEDEVEKNLVKDELKDLFSLAKLTDLDLIKNFYEENKDKVNEPEKLRQRAQEQYKAIRNAKKMFEGVENG